MEYDIIGEELRKLYDAINRLGDGRREEDKVWV